MSLLTEALESRKRTSDWLWMGWRNKVIKAQKTTEMPPKVPTWIDSEESSGAAKILPDAVVAWTPPSPSDLLGKTSSSCKGKHCCSNVMSFERSAKVVHPTRHLHGVRPLTRSLRCDAWRWHEGAPSCYSPLEAPKKEPVDAAHPGPPTGPAEAESTEERADGRYPAGCHQTYHYIVSPYGLCSSAVHSTRV
ncbi:unnamed protein product [Nyctereutes procyonoides]|uniref:(raccoon dog) hypothetical protein n=1 Tax=Nyctereutes procyonoides TaxID=34880 RepID=A0A811Y438_NYCPR|nr:unnamed protein product [Nyctereutes procyonoides]